MSKINLSPLLVDTVYFGNVINAGQGQNIANQISSRSGCKNVMNATTINKVCASGMKGNKIFILNILAIEFAAKDIFLGLADVVIAGGTESLSNVPHYISLRNKKYGTQTIDDGIEIDGLKDAFEGLHMGVYVDQCAKKYSVTRAEQDEYALRSYKNAIKAHEDGFYKNEIAKIYNNTKDNESFFDWDEELDKFDESKVASRKPLFTDDGTATAANLSSLSDGAAAVVVMSSKKFHEIKKDLKINNNEIYKIITFADHNQSPNEFTTSSVYAIEKCLKKSNIDKNDIDCFEINEASSSIVLANIKLLNLESHKVNLFGGGVSIGYPLGASGARIMVTLCNILFSTNQNIGCAAVCNGGGGATAMIISKIKF